jgi:hypothetical protein
MEIASVNCTLKPLGAFFDEPGSIQIRRNWIQ